RAQAARRAGGRDARRVDLRPGADCQLGDSVSAGEISGPPMRTIEITIDGKKVSVPEGSTILAACRALGVDTPTLCWAENLTPVNVCRVCVVEVEGARTLAPACSRQVEPGMVVKTDSARVRTSRKLVLE